ncbi:hypothetical protein VNO78_22660 [Psophocarpus tetragonolobus]|uniref:BHLH domain-containing protein n=1 Tax=Psophocarpus tetragonolobus TaxID=3891 RepID=A0AAN9S539_PSOTE
MNKQKGKSSVLCLSFKYSLPYSDSLMLLMGQRQTAPDSSDWAMLYFMQRRNDTDSTMPPPSTINMERQRRSKMTQMFTQLRTTVPGVLPQATREVIINKTIGYIKELEKKKERLEELKESMKGAEGSKHECGNSRKCSVTVTVSANVAFFGIQSLPRPGLTTLILKVFCNYQADILAANVSVNNGKFILAITTLLQNDHHGKAVVQNIKRDIMSL